MSTNYYPQKQMNFSDIKNISNQVKELTVNPTKNPNVWIIDYQRDDESKTNQQQKDCLHMFTTDGQSEIKGFCRYGANNVMPLVWKIEEMCKVKIHSEHSLSNVQIGKGREKMVVYYKTLEEKQLGSDYCIKNGYIPYFYDVSDLPNLGTDLFLIDGLIAGSILEEGIESQCLWFYDLDKICDRDSLNSTLSYGNGDFKLVEGKNNK